MNVKHLAAAFSALALAACSNPEPNPEMVPSVVVPGEGETPSYNPEKIPEFTYNVVPYAGERAADSESYPEGNPDLNPTLTDWNNVVTVVYNGSEATVSGAAEAGVTASVIGANVSLALGETRSVRIVASGSSDCGSLRLTGSYKHLLELNNLMLTAVDRPAINDQIKKRMFLVVRGENRLTDGSDYLTSSEQRKGCLFAEDHIVLCGDGVLEIEGNYRHGLVTDGYLFVNPGVTLAVTKAAKNAIHVKGSGINNDFRGIEITGGYVYANTSAPAGKAMKSDANIAVRGGKLALYASGAPAVDADGMLSSAACLKSDMNVSITGGTLSLISPANGGKGITSDGNMTINGSQLKIALGGKAEAGNLDSSVPKGLNAHGSLLISAGGVSISAIGAGSTAIGCDGAFAMTGAVVYAFATNNGLKAMEALVSGGIMLCGGAKNSPCDGCEVKLLNNVEAATITQIFDGQQLKGSFKWPGAMTDASLIYRL